MVCVSRHTKKTATVLEFKHELLRVCPQITNVWKNRKFSFCSSSSLTISRRRAMAKQNGTELKSAFRDVEELTESHCPRPAKKPKEYHSSRFIVN